MQHNYTAIVEIRSLSLRMKLKTERQNQNFNQDKVATDTPSYGLASL